MGLTCFYIFSCHSHGNTSKANAPGMTLRCKSNSISQVKWATIPGIIENSKKARGPKYLLARAHPSNEKALAMMTPNTKLVRLNREPQAT